MSNKKVQRKVKLPNGQEVTEAGLERFEEKLGDKVQKEWLAALPVPESDKLTFITRVETSAKGSSFDPKTLGRICVVAAWERLTSGLSANERKEFDPNVLFARIRKKGTLWGTLLPKE
ncbi:hypothetical protein HZC00_02760 [Candidatus Kaiserbacteria bacterium]|nr:hypothetical protein [Candidatus Kaiserbacteria bacterium]